MPASTFASLRAGFFSLPMYLHPAEQLEEQLEERLLRETERRALQVQIQPHFLYNTLGAVKSMAKFDDFEAVSAIVTDLN